MRTPAVAWVSGLALLLALQGCTVGIGIHAGRRPALENRPPDIAHSRLVGNTLHVDLRRHPTRDDLGMNPTTTFAGYGSTDQPIQAVVDLPRATLTFPRTDITFATSEAGGANDPSPAMHQPRFFTLYVHYPDRDAARADALAKAPALGLRPDQVDAALDDPSGEHDEYGVPDGWLSARLGFYHGSTEATYTAFYYFDLDLFHNPVVDAIKKGDTVVLDLRAPPSRATLGFFPDGFLNADISPDPGHRLTIDLRSARGTAEWRLSEGDPVSSSSTTTDGPPSATSVSTCDSPVRIRSALIGVADVIGLDRSHVRALPVSIPDDSEPRKGPELIVEGHTTSFRTQLKYEAADGFSRIACATVRLDY